MNLQVEGNGYRYDRACVGLDYDDDFMVYKRPDGEGYGVIVKAGDKYYHVPKVIRMECEAVYDERDILWEVCAVQKAKGVGGTER